MVGFVQIYIELTFATILLIDDDINGDAQSDINHSNCFFLKQTKEEKKTLQTLTCLKYLIYTIVFHTSMRVFLIKHLKL